MLKYLQKCYEVKTKQDIKDFISFGKSVNKRIDKKLEKRLLSGTHELSNNFNIIAFMIKKNDKTVSRAVLTTYNNDKTGYVGLFESKNDKDAVGLLIHAIKHKAIALHKEKLVGPVDCSFWIKYRMKVSNFEYTYTGEPNNKEYYPDLWRNAGFEVYETYHSSRLRVPTSSDINDKYLRRLDRISESGIKIRTITNESFDTDFKNIYTLLSRLYKKFPVYKEINYESFKNMFWYFKYILDYKMVFVAYKEDKLQGFMVCIPNYEKTNILRVKLGKCKEYVVMYLGVDYRAYGLGAAFAEVCRVNLEKRGSTSISALIHDGNISGGFFKELEIERYNYNLYNMDII